MPADKVEEPEEVVPEEEPEGKAEEGAEDEPKEVEGEEGEEEEEKSVQFDGLNEDSLRVATALYKGLNNPETAERTIRSIAESLGVKIEQEVSSEKSKQTGKKTLGEFVEDKLKNMDNGRFASLAPVFTTLFEGFADEFVTPQFTATQKQTQAQMAENAYNKLGEKYDDFIEKANEIDELSKILSPTSRLETQKDFEKYLEILYRAAGGNTQSAKSLAKTVKKIKKNSQGSGLAPSGGSGDRNKAGASRVTLQEAIQAAMDGKTLE